MTTVHRDGLTRLPSGDASGDQSRLNIIFVHGLCGHPRRTWETTPGRTSERRSDTTKKHRSVKSWFQLRETASHPTSTEQAHPSSSSSSSVFWPELYLASDIPQATVWTYGYNADIIGGLFQANNQNSISQHGRDMSVRLEREFDNNQPIAFVVHSLGGVIVKDAIHRSERICERTKLIIFLGTPHRGSAYVSWGQIASNIARLALQDSNKKVLEALEVNSEVLDNINEEFKIIVVERGIKIHSFQEARGISGMKGLDAKVVDTFSSKLDLPRTLETVETIDANHMQIARYSSRDDSGYRAIVRILQSFVRQELESQPIPPTNVAVAVSRASRAHIDLPLAEDLDNSLRFTRHRGTTARSRHSDFAGKGLVTRCFRCDAASHLLYDCYASPQTVQNGRNRRKGDGRCINCGATGHWKRDCSLEDLF